MLPRNCEVKIVDLFYYEPTVFQSVTLNKSKPTFNYSIDVNKITLPKQNIDVKPMEHPKNTILAIYKTKVMPWLSLAVVPILLFVCFLTFIIVRKLVLNRLYSLSQCITENAKRED